MFFHTAISNHLSEKPKRCLVLYGRLRQVLLYIKMRHYMTETSHVFAANNTSDNVTDPVNQRSLTSVFVTDPVKQRSLTSFFVTDPMNQHSLTSVFVL